ncbi:protein MIZU-KUSSEI 1 [Fagus crenata]|jgi:uncharacterized protein (TIGR01570 family)
MTKNIDALRRFLPSCLFPTSTNNTTTTTTHKSTATTTTKKRLSTSLRDDLPERTHQETKNQDQDSQTSSTSSNNTTISTISFSQPRTSKSMVVGTIFGPRRGHVWFCIQHDRLSSKPIFLLELSIVTTQLVKEMSAGLVRIALECDKSSELGSCPLRSVPLWTMYCNGRKIGFAARRKATERVKSMLKTMQSTTVGAGVIPSAPEDLMYMRAYYEHVVGNSDSESFHLINPDECQGQELSLFLLRSSNGNFL